jgi:HEAT repeat protein
MQQTSQRPLILAAALFISAGPAPMALFAADEDAPQTEQAPAAVAPETVRALGAKLAQADLGKRAQAVAEVAQQGPSAAPALARIIDAPADYWASLGAIETLRRLDAEAAPAAGSTLAMVVGQAKRQSYERQVAAETLGAWRWAPATPTLIDVLRERLSPELRETASWALVQIGEPAVPALAAALRGQESGPFRERVVRTLAEIGPAAAPAVPQLIAALEVSKRNVQRAATPSQAGSSAEPVETYDVRRAAIRALGKIGPAAAAAAIPALTQAQQSPQDPEEAQAIAQALARVNPPAVSE